MPLDERRPTPAHEAAERALLREQVERALAELPESQRSALMLREFGGLAYAEIAEAMPEARKRQIRMRIVERYDLPEEMGSRTVVELVR